MFETASLKPKRLYKPMHFTSPSIKLTLIGARVGGVVGKAIANAVVEGKLSPEILGDALLSSSSLRSHIQAEALRIIAVRVSCKVPGRLSWLVKLIIDYLTTQSCGGDALRMLGKRTLLYHITGFGLHGTIASALAAAAVQMSINTCWLVTSQIGIWRHASVASVMSTAQYKYESITTAYTLVGTLAGGGVGAALGSLLMPGFGTALGSIICSTCAGCLPTYWRNKKGPDDASKRQVELLKEYNALTTSTTTHGYVIMDIEDELRRVTLKEKHDDNSNNSNINSNNKKDHDNTNESNRKKQSGEEEKLSNFIYNCSSEKDSAQMLNNKSIYEEDSFVVFELVRKHVNNDVDVDLSSSTMTSIPVSNTQLDKEGNISSMSLETSDKFNRTNEGTDTKIPHDIVQSRMCFEQNLNELHESESEEFEECNMINADNMPNETSNEEKEANNINIVEAHSLISIIDHSNDTLLNGEVDIDVSSNTSSNHKNNTADVNESEVNKINNNSYSHTKNVSNSISFTEVTAVNAMTTTPDSSVSGNNNKKNNSYNDDKTASIRSSALMRRIMGGKVEYIEGRSWSEIDTMMESYSEDEVVFVFAVDGVDDTSKK